MRDSKENSPALFLLRFIWPYTPIVIMTVLALSLAAGTVLFLGTGLRSLVDNGFVTANASLLNQALISLLVLVGIMSIASFARSYLSSYLGEKVGNKIKTHLFGHLLTLTPEFYQKHGVGQLHSQLHNDTALIQILLGGSASTGLRSLIQLVGAMTLLFISNTKLALLACLMIPLTLLPIVIFGKRVRLRSINSQTAETALASYSNECLASIQTIQAYGQQADVLYRFKQMTKGVQGLANSRILAQSSLSTTVICLVFAAVSGLMWYGGHEVLANRITPGGLISFVFYAVLAAGSINSLSQVYGDWQRALGACSRLQELLNVFPEIRNPSKPRALPHTAIGAISFANVDFTYPGANHQLLNDFNLNIKRGETIALVGPSGAGKSTVLNLLMRFYDPSQGQILIEGVDIKELDVAILRQHMGWVPQEPTIFNDTVYENIRFSYPDATNLEVENAARAAYAYEFVTKLPEGFHTLLGPDGVGLSSGQKQRIAIARAILKAPSILLLDEATNALDSESEFQVQKALDQLMKGRTTLIVAHRLSTVLNANRILVMEGGQIVAMGTHTTLMRQNALYQRFVELQFDHPRPNNIERNASNYLSA